MLNFALDRLHADSAPAALCHLSCPIYALLCLDPSALLPWRVQDIARVLRFPLDRLYADAALPPGMIYLCIALPWLKQSVCFNVCRSLPVCSSFPLTASMLTQSLQTPGVLRCLDLNDVCLDTCRSLPASSSFPSTACTLIPTEPPTRHSVSRLALHLTSR